MRVSPRHISVQTRAVSAEARITAEWTEPITLQQQQQPAARARVCVSALTHKHSHTFIHSHTPTHTHGLFPLTGPMSARLGNTHSRGPGLRFAAVWQLFSPAYERRSSIIPVFASEMLHFSARIREFCAASRRRRCCPSIWREERSGGGAPLVHDGKCSSLSVANINKVRYKKIHVNIY